MQHIVKRCKRWRWKPPALAVALGSLLLLGVWPATTAGEDLPGTFGEMIEVRVVNVEVVVTDRDGVRVRGLQPEDFRLRVDGEERSIDFFTEIRGGEAVETAEDRPAPAGVTEGEPVGTSYLLFIDDFFSIEQDRDQVLEAMEEQLSLLGPEDRMAIVAYDGELEMLSNWSRSARELTDALARARERKAHGLKRLAELRTSDELLEDMPVIDRPFRTQLRGLERDYARRLYQQEERAVQAVVSTLQGFATPPGRNVMVLLAGGWPYSPAQYTVNTYFSTFEDQTVGLLESDYAGRSQLFGRITDTANLLGYTIYPVDVPGVFTRTEAGAARAAPRPVGNLATANRESQVEDTLYFLASETGGKALVDGRRDDAVRVPTQDTRSYYWLGFYPDRAEDDQRHNIEVEVLRPGTRVRTREDFVDLSRDKEIDLMVRSALMFGNPPTNQPVALSFGEPQKTEGSRFQLPLEVGIPVDAIETFEENGEYVGQVEVRIQAIDSEGNLSPIATKEVSIRGDDKPQAGEFFVYQTTLKLSRDTERVVVAVYDPLSGRILSGLVKLDTERLIEAA